MLPRCRLNLTTSFCYLRHSESAGVLIRTHCNLFTLSMKHRPSARLWECHGGGLDLGQMRWEAIKQASTARGSAAKTPGGRVTRDGDLRSGSWKGKGGGGISCHLHSPQPGRRWSVSARSDLLRAQQVLTSRLRLACRESDSSGSQGHCLLITMCTGSS